MKEEIVNTDSSEVTARIFGAFDAHAREIEKAFGVDINNRAQGAGDSIVVTGEEASGVRMAASVLTRMRDGAGDSEEITDQQVAYLIGMVRDGQEEELSELSESTVCITGRGKPVRAKTVGQKKYVEAIRQNTVILGVGPAGTGKTFLAVAMAVRALREKQVSRIILTRPAIEAGEKLGFLPGDLQSKIDPYLRPLYDALFEMMGTENYARLLEKGVIEIAPLAYMRGRTLDDSFIILDEAQNATPEQMKMFLTRLGNNSKAVVTGDLTQTDLPSGVKSGLSAAVRILSGIPDIAVHYFTDRDVVRHKLVQKIILAYEKYEREERRPRKNERAGK
ncbi:MAG: PhoH family protein [Clostridia bacterium]|nr:PhoH family protein [Clostridia bacterium]MDD7700231.1 PhoH family protein [Eubacteriales bacterium]MDY2827111.1 PhoH family protein [Eubacteriales bacterium]